MNGLQEFREAITHDVPGKKVLHRDDDDAAADQHHRDQHGKGHPLRDSQQVPFALLEQPGKCSNQFAQAEVAQRGKHADRAGEQD